MKREVLSPQEQFANMQQLMVRDAATAEAAETQLPMELELECHLYRMDDGAGNVRDVSTAASRKQQRRLTRKETHSMMQATRTAESAGTEVAFQDRFELTAAATAAKGWHEVHRFGSGADRTHVTARKRGAGGGGAEGGAVGQGRDDERQTEGGG